MWSSQFFIETQRYSLLCHVKLFALLTVSCYVVLCYTKPLPTNPYSTSFMCEENIKNLLPVVNFAKALIAISWWMLFTFVKVLCIMRNKRRAYFRYLMASCVAGQIDGWLICVWETGWDKLCTKKFGQYWSASFSFCCQNIIYNVFGIVLHFVRGNGVIVRSESFTLRCDDISASLS